MTITRNTQITIGPVKIVLPEWRTDGYSVQSAKSCFETNNLMGTCDVYFTWTVSPSIISLRGVPFDDFDLGGVNSVLRRNDMVYLPGLMTPG